MRFIFVDEAGTSGPEPVTIVVGLIAHADSHIVLAERLLNEALGAVPNQFQNNFVFHSTEIWNSKRYHNNWRMTDRIALLEQVISIPRRLGMAISMGLVRAGAPCDEKDAEELGITVNQFEHLRAFSGCLARADKYIREYAGPTEVATVVAEDVPEMRRHLRAAPLMLAHSAGRFNATLTKKDSLVPNAIDQVNGYVGQEADFRITRIRHPINFVSKNEEPLVQIADACSFGFRRFFSTLEHGEGFTHAILGGLPDRNDYAGPETYLTYFFHPPKKQITNPVFTL